MIPIHVMGGPGLKGLFFNQTTTGYHRGMYNAVQIYPMKYARCLIMICCGLPGIRTTKHLPRDNEVTLNSKDKFGQCRVPTKHIQYELCA